jgi:hypothetical protein
MQLEAKRTVLHEWHRVAAFLQFQDRRNELVYILPTAGAVDEIEQHAICRNALAGLLNIGKDLWAVAIHDPEKVNSKTGKTGTESSKGKGSAEVRASVIEFLSKLKETTVDPFATRIVRTETGTTTRYDVDETVLPPHMTKRKIYESWCFSRGYKPTKSSTAKSTYKPLSEYEMREYDDDISDGEDEDAPVVALWPHGSEYKRSQHGQLFYRTGV